MGIFYHPPQPTQAAPHVPIPPQGDQPPRKAAAAPSALAWHGAVWTVQRRALSAAWDVPAVQAGPVPLAARPWVIWDTAWQTNPEPALPRRGIAPLTLVYGDAPPVALPAALRAALTQWQDSPNVLPPRPGVAAWDVPATAEHIPPSLLPLAILIAWQSQQADITTRRGIAPLTLSYGDAPPPKLLSAVWQVLSQWLGPEWRAQAPQPSAAWNIPPPVPGDAPPPRLVQWQVLAKYFDTTWSAQRQSSINAAAEGSPTSTSGTRRQRQIKSLVRRTRRCR